MPLSLPFLPEFHDVDVTNFEAVARFLQQLAAGGAPSWSLMVVPDGGDADGERRVAFARQLRVWRQQGHVLHLHGCRHRADVALPRTWRGRMALKMTNNEAEFAGLDGVDSWRLLQRALVAWRVLDVGDAAGFVAPTWHDNAFLRAQCRDAGLGAYGGRARIWDLRTGASRRSPAFSFAGLPAWSLPVVRGLAVAYIRLTEKFKLPMPRLVLHPVDFAPEQAPATLALLRALLSRKGSN